MSSPRRIIRFYPQDSSSLGYDDTCPPVLSFLDKDEKPEIGKTVRVVTGNILKPNKLKLSNKFVKIGKLLTPIEVNTIWNIGLNYSKHVVECGLKMSDLPNNPVFFMQPKTCVINPNENILLPACCKKDEVDYEGELVIVIGKTCKNVSRTNALDYVLGYTIGHDVSARDWQLNEDLQGGQWLRGKTFDTFAPIGPALLLQESGLNPNNLGIYTYLNGVKMQDSNTKDFIYSVEEMVEYLSKDCTLMAGTVIFTGTPEGVGFFKSPKLFLKPGDSVRIGVEGIGELVNGVKNAPKVSKL